jgi:hypothetical protein
MIKQRNTYIIILVSLFLLYVGVEIFRPKAIDWSLNFGSKSKNPYGCYILKQELTNLVYGCEISDNSIDLYRALNKSFSGTNSLMIITEIFKPDNSEMESLLQFVASGNNAFISAQEFGDVMKDSLKLVSTQTFSESVDAVNELKIQIVNPHFPKPLTYRFKKISPFYFNNLDTINTTILEKDSLDRAIYIKTKYGRGCFYFHSNPLVFTNYHLVYSSGEYPARSLAYLNNSKIIWDEYYKPSREKQAGSTPLRYILSQSALRYAYILFVITWIIFVLFVGKRKQRVVPVFEKPRNQSVDFIEIVGQLYYNQRDNKDIFNKKIIHFADFVHSALYLKFLPEDPGFRKDFANKVNIPIEKANKFYNLMVKLQNKETISEQQLTSFIIEIDQFQYPNHA